MPDIELRLPPKPDRPDTDRRDGAGGPAAAGGAIGPAAPLRTGRGFAAAFPSPKDHPVAGYFAVGFGVLGIFTHGYVFSPVAFICGLIALFTGQGMWALVGLVLAVAGMATSPVLLGMLGLAVLFDWLPW